MTACSDMGDLNHITPPATAAGLNQATASPLCTLHNMPANALTVFAESPFASARATLEMIGRIALN